MRTKKLICIALSLTLAFCLALPLLGESAAASESEDLHLRMFNSWSVDMGGG
jgi:hypothetical protein